MAVGIAVDLSLPVGPQHVQVQLGGITPRLPARLELLEAPQTALVTIQEGKYHQVKRMLAARGKPVLSLRRLSMGPLTLDRGLKPGKWRFLSAQERAELQRLKGTQ